MNANLENNNVIQRLFSTIETDGLIKSNNGQISREISWFTPWSVGHFVGGMLLRGMGSSLITTLVFHTIYEFVNHNDDKLIKKWRNEGYPWFYGDSIQNSIGDTICTVVGWFLFDKIIRIGRIATLITSGMTILVGYLFLSSNVQSKISLYRNKYMKDAYGLENNNKVSKGSYINFLGDKLAMPFALGLFIGIGLFILYATGSYYPKIVA